MVSTLSGSIWQHFDRVGMERQFMENKTDVARHARDLVAQGCH